MSDRKTQLQAVDAATHPAGSWQPAGPPALPVLDGKTRAEVARARVKSLPARAIEENGDWGDAWWRS